MFVCVGVDVEMKWPQREPWTRLGDVELAEKRVMLDCVDASCDPL